MPPVREMAVRAEILAEEERGLAESEAARDAAERGTKAYRLASRNVGHFKTRIARTRKRMKALSEQMSAEPPVADMDQERARRLRRLRANSQTMLGRFLVVTPGHNAAFLAKLGVSDLGDVDLDAILRTEYIRLVSLDNPERWVAEGGQDVQPQKFLALHPTDVTPALRALRHSLSRATTGIPEEELAERATVAWLPRNRSKFQHPDPAKTVYPAGIERLALDHRPKSSQKGWAILRGWGKDLDRGVPPINGCEVEFEAVPHKGRFHALLDPSDVEEIAL